jgi:uncharacterized membrane protein
MLIPILAIYAASLTHYRITDIGPASNTYGVYINNRGQVAGTTNFSRRHIKTDGLAQDLYAYNAFFWENGHRIHIGGAAGYPNSSAAGINDKGEVVGTLDDTDAGGIEMIFVKNIFVWKNGTVTNVGAPSGSDVSIASGINDSGEIIGTRIESGSPNGSDNASSNAPHAVTEFQGIWADLPGSDAAVGINDKGQVAVSGTIADGSYHASIRQNGTTTDLGKFDAAGAINNNGELLLIRGSSLYVWQQGRLTLLPLPQGFQGIDPKAPVSLNDNDLIVASGVLSKGNGDRAIVWRNDTPIDLNKLVRGPTLWVLQEATSVNNKGQIVGIGSYQNTTHAFLLAPITK